MTTSSKSRGALLLLLLGLALALTSTDRAQAKEPDLGPHVTVAKGGVGESGASQLLYHPVKGKAKVLVLHTVDTSLCGNTGAVATLLVNGSLEASGVITAQGSSLRANARPGDHVVVVVHTIPLFNQIMCVRLGELSVELRAHDAPK